VSQFSDDFQAYSFGVLSSTHAETISYTESGEAARDISAMVKREGYATVRSPAGGDEQLRLARIYPRSDDNTNGIVNPGFDDTWSFVWDKGGSAVTWKRRRSEDMEQTGGGLWDIPLVEITLDERSRKDYRLDRG